MKRLLLLVTIISCAAPISYAQNTGELLHFKHTGGLTNYECLEVSILSDGSGLVECRMRKEHTINHPFQLTHNELEALEIHVVESKFFKQPDKDTQWATDQGRTVMRITMGGESRQLEYEYRPEMVPITSFLYKLYREAQTIDGLKTRRDAYNAYTALTGADEYRILHPASLKGPLTEFINASSDFKQLCWAASALSFLANNEEVLGFWSKELAGADESRRIALLKLLNEHDLQWASEKHKSALSPLFLVYLEKEYRNWPKMTDGEHDVYMSIITYLSAQTYQDAAPVFKDMIERKYELRKYNGETFSRDILQYSLESAVSRMEKAK